MTKIIGVTKNGAEPPRPKIPTAAMSQHALWLRQFSQALQVRQPGSVMTPFLLGCVTRLQQAADYVDGQDKAMEALRQEKQDLEAELGKLREGR